MLFFYGIWMLCHHGLSLKKEEKSKQRFLGYNEKTHFPFVKSARKPRNVSFLTQNPRFLRIVGNPAARGPIKLMVKVRFEFRRAKEIPHKMTYKVPFLNFFFEKSVPRWSGTSGSTQVTTYYLQCRHIIRI